MTPFDHSPGFEADDAILYAVRHQIDYANRNLDFDLIEGQFRNIVCCISQLLEQINVIGARSLMSKNYTEVLVTKLLLHGSSIFSLSKPVPICKNAKDVSKSIYDIASIYTLARAQIEAFGVWYYLILSPVNEEEKEFRGLIYELSGLKNRQKYRATAKENLEKKKVESKQAAEILQKIVNHHLYSALTEPEQKRISGKRPPALLFPWEKLVERSRLKSFFYDHWKYYSNYAHSEFISKIQLVDYLKNQQDAAKAIYHVLEVSTIIACVTVTEMLNLAPELIQFYKVSNDIELRTYINQWARIGIK